MAPECSPALILACWIGKTGIVDGVRCPWAARSGRRSLVGPIGDVAWRRPHGNPTRNICEGSGDPKAHGRRPRHDIAWSLRESAMSPPPEGKPDQLGGKRRPQLW